MRLTDSKLGLIISAFLVSPAIVTAAQNPFGQLTDLLQNLVVSMGKLADFAPGDQKFAFKVILFFLFFTIFYTAGLKTFKDQEKTNTIASTIAFLISFAAVIIIPDPVMRYIMETFGAVLIAIILMILNGLPIAFMYGSPEATWTAKNWFAHSPRALAAVRTALAFFMLFFLMYLEGKFGLSAGQISPGTQQTQTFSQSQSAVGGPMSTAILSIVGNANGLLMIFYSVVIFMGIFNLFRGGGGVRTKRGSPGSSSSSKSLADKVDETVKSVANTIDDDLLADDDEFLQNEIETNIEDILDEYEPTQKMTEEFANALDEFKAELDKYDNAHPKTDPRRSSLAASLEKIRRILRGTSDNEQLRDQVERELEKVEGIGQEAQALLNGLQAAENDLQDRFSKKKNALESGQDLPKLFEATMNQIKEAAPRVSNVNDGKDSDQIADELKDARASMQTLQDDLTDLILDDNGQQIFGLPNNFNLQQIIDALDQNIADFSDDNDPTHSSHDLINQVNNQADLFNDALGRWEAQMQQFELDLQHLSDTLLPDCEGLVNEASNVAQEAQWVRNILDGGQVKIGPRAQSVNGLYPEISKTDFNSLQSTIQDPEEDPEMIVAELRDLGDTLSYYHNILEDGLEEWSNMIERLTGLNQNLKDDIRDNNALPNPDNINP